MINQSILDQSINPQSISDDEDDVKREIRNVYCRTNMMICRFRKCSLNVKLQTVYKLLYVYILYVCIALWSKYNILLLSCNDLNTVIINAVNILWLFKYHSKCQSTDLC